MKDNTTTMLRLTGIAGVVAALCWILGDALLLGTKATPEQYPILAKYIGKTDFVSWVVQLGEHFFGASSERLAAGALVAVLTTPLYLAGVWHLFLALKPAGKWSSIAPFLLLFVGQALAPFVHGSFYYIAEMLKLLPQVDASAQAVILNAATRATIVLFGTYAVLAAVTLAGFVWMIVTIIRGKSLYPRWVAISNPILLMVAGYFLGQVLPYPLSLWLGGAALNLGLLFFFVLSLALLWNRREEVWKP